MSNVYTRGISECRRRRCSKSTRKEAFADEKKFFEKSSGRSASEAELKRKVELFIKERKNREWKIRHNWPQAYRIKKVRNRNIHQHWPRWLSSVESSLQSNLRCQECLRQQKSEKRFAEIGTSSIAQQVPSDMEWKKLQSIQHHSLGAANFCLSPSSGRGQSL